MKKILIFGLAVLLIATMFISCEKEPTYNVQSDDPIESHDNESTANPNDSTDDNSISETTQSEKFFADQKVFKIEIDTGTFLVKQTKHTYRDSDLILLYIENQSSKDYSLTISGKYLDQSREIIKSEEQTFDQYYSGYKNYFLFYPDAYFSDFEFTLSFGEVKKLSNDDPRSSDKDIRVTDFEYNKLGIQEPDIVIFLTAPFEMIAEMRKGRVNNEGIQNDLHERDLENPIYQVDNTTTFFLTQDGYVYIVYAYGNYDYTNEMDVIIF